MMLLVTGSITANLIFNENLTNVQVSESYVMTSNNKFMTGCFEMVSTFYAVNVFAAFSAAYVCIERMKLGKNRAERSTVTR